MNVGGMSVLGLVSPFFFSLSSLPSKGLNTPRKQVPTTTYLVVLTTPALRALSTTRTRSPLSDDD